MRFVVGLLSVVALAFAVPAAAGPPVTEVFVDVFDDVNPCTGEVMTVRFDGTAYIHEHGSRVVVRAERTITTSDGFVGRGVDSFVDNGQVVRGQLADILANASGDRFMARSVFVLDLSTDTLRVERFDLICLNAR